MPKAKEKKEMTKEKKKMTKEKGAKYTAFINNNIKKGINKLYQKVLIINVKIIRLIFFVTPGGWVMAELHFFFN